MTINEQIIYYYRNGWRAKDIAAKLGLTVCQVKYRLHEIRKTRPVKRWWEEDTV